MPTNKRINEMIQAGLINRGKVGEKLKVTPLGEDFLKHIEQLKEERIKNIADMI